MKLIEKLKKEGWLKTKRIIQAFEKIKRKDFVVERLKESANLNRALPIDKGQTISQPLVVAFMLEKLSPQSGEKILDIGSGSGWTTALLAEIVGEKGKVFGVEIIPELLDFGKKNVKKYNFIKKKIVKFICKDGSKGLPKEQPFDRILASAAGNKIPEEWKRQLKKGGKIVAPVDSSIIVLTKESKDDWEKEEYSGFSFVPLVNKK